MAAINAALSFVILALNILDAFKALKPSRSSKSSSSIDSSNPLSELGQSTSTSIRVVRSPIDGTPNKSKEQRQRIGSAERRAGLRAQLLILLVWVCWRRMETILDQTLGWILPFYETFKTVFLLWLLASRSIGSSQIFYNVVLPFVKPYESLLDSIFIQSSNFSSLLIFLISLPIARLTASFKNDNWFGWVRGWSWRSIFGSSNLEPVSSSSNSPKSGGDGDGNGNGGSSIRAVNGNSGGSRRTPVARVMESRIESQAQPRKPSTLQAPTKLRTVSSSANLSNKISKSDSISQAERKRTTSLTNPTAVVEKLRSIPAPPTGFGPSTSSQTQVTKKPQDTNNMMKTYAFIPGQTPPRRGLLEPPLQVPTSVAGLTSPHPPGAFGSNLNSFSNNQNFGPSSSKEPFMPVSRAPFRIFADPVDESESASASGPKNNENGIERNHQGEDVEMDSSSSRIVKGSTPKSTSSFSNKKTYNNNLNSKNKVVSSRSSTFRAKGTVKASSVQSKIPNQRGEESNVNGDSERPAKGQKKKSIPKSSSIRTLRSRSVTPADAESQEDEEEESGEENDGSSSDQISKDDDDQLTPRKRKATMISSPSKRLRSRNGKVSSSQPESDSNTKSRDLKGKGKAVDGNGKTSGTIGSSSKMVNSSSTASKASAPSTRASKQDSVISEREEGVRGVSEGRGRGRTQRGTTRGRGRGNLRDKV